MSYYSALPEENDNKINIRLRRDLDSNTYLDSDTAFPQGKHRFESDFFQESHLEIE